MTKKFTDPSTMQMKNTLARKFIPLADSLRDLMTKFGLRQYKVRIVRVRWSGGRRGQGSVIIEKALDILPTPLVTDLQGIAEVVNPVGLDEAGQVTVAEISGRFTEDDLRLIDNGNTPGRDEEVFYEIEFLNGEESIKRRFYPSSAPTYSPGRLQWRINLTRAHEDRRRNGDPPEHGTGN